MTTRRNLLVALCAGALAAPFASFAQQQRPKIVRIGLLEASTSAMNVKRRQALVEGLRQLGYVEGKNMSIEHRSAAGKYERLPDLAAELVQMNVEVIVAASPPAVKAAQRATTSIPIVMVATSDPVAAGLVASLSRPGANTTGVSNLIEGTSSKFVELLRAAVPKLSRIAVLTNPAQQGHPGLLTQIETSARRHGVKISPVSARSAGDIDAAFTAMKQARAEALIVLPDSMFNAQARRIAEAAAEHRLPTMFGIPEPVEAGGFMSYGVNGAEHYFRAATYIDKILKGAKPADLPVEQPTKFELAINLKTAKAIGLTIPQELLLRADKVIE